jgi:hypothetical protein
MESLEKFGRAWGTAVQAHPEEIKALLKRNGVFTPDNADLPTLTKMSLAALGTSEAFRNDAAKWSQGKARQFSNANGTGDPVLDTTSVGSTASTGSKIPYGDIFNLIGQSLSAWGQTRAARYNAEAAASYALSQQQQNQNTGMTAPPPPQQAGFSFGKPALYVLLAGVVGYTIYYFVKKK